MVKAIHSFNASDEVVLLLEQNAPKGKGFSAWINKELIEGNNLKKNKIETKSTVTNIGFEL